MGFSASRSKDTRSVKKPNFSSIKNRSDAPNKEQRAEKKGKERSDPLFSSGKSNAPQSQSTQIPLLNNDRDKERSHRQLRKEKKDQREEFEKATDDVNEDDTKSTHRLPQSSIKAHKKRTTDKSAKLIKEVRKPT